MLSNRLAFAAVSLACVAAAAGGSYLATRQSQASSAMAAPAPTAVAPATTAPAAQPTTASDASLANASVATRNSLPGSAGVAPSGALTRAAQTDHSSPSAVGAGKTPMPPASARKTPLPTLERTWPGSQTGGVLSQQDAAASPAPVALPDAPAPAARQDDIRTQEPSRGLEPERAPEQTAEKQFEELVVSADSVIGLQLETTLSSERARVEDRVDARVVRDVRVGGRVAIPAGAHAIGSVMVVDQGGKFKTPARLGIRFNTLMLADGTKLPITTETIYRNGESPSNGTAAKIGGGAVIGTILGGILGGAKGAAVGAAAGAGGGAAATAAGDRAAVTLQAGTQMTARFLSPVTVTIEK